MVRACLAEALATLGIEAEPEAHGAVSLLLPRRVLKDVNHGKESHKFNQDCTICRTCR